MFENFRETIFNTLYEYKKVLKRHLSAGEYCRKIRALGIKRMNLREMSEIDLHKLLYVMLQDLENYKCKDSLYVYSGIHEFIKHIKNIVKHFHVEDKTIVHTSHTASQKIIDIIQIVSTNATFNDKIMDEVNVCLQKIMQYGNLEQVDMVINALKQQASEKKEICDYLLAQLEAHFRKMLQNPSPSLKTKI